MSLNEHLRIALNLMMIAEDVSLPGNSVDLNICSIFDFVPCKGCFDKHWEIPNISVLSNISAFSRRFLTVSLSLVRNCIVKHLSAVCPCGFLLFLSFSKMKWFKAILELIYVLQLISLSFMTAFNCAKPIDSSFAILGKMLSSKSWLVSFITVRFPRWNELFTKFLRNPWTSW